MSGDPIPSHLLQAVQRSVADHDLRESLHALLLTRRPEMTRAQREAWIAQTFGKRPPPPLSAPPPPPDTS